MDAEWVFLAVSLALLTAALAVLAGRSLLRFLRQHEPTQAMWAGGMSLAAAAMAIEAAVFVGYTSTVLLEGYVFASAALVGLLSIGCSHVIRVRWFVKTYAGFILAACAALAFLSFSTPLPSSMVSNGIISGDPPLSLLIVSSIVTGPATIVLLAASVVSLRRSHRWQTLMIIAGALVLGTGGSLYIASFPVFLYYAEFIGIVLLFAGVVSLPTPARLGAPDGRLSGAAS